MVTSKFGTDAQFEDGGAGTNPIISILCKDGVVYLTLP